MDTLNIARWQFGITTVYHFFFVPLTIGLAWSERAELSPPAHTVLSYFRQRYVEPPPRHRPARR